jgi:predicted ATP-dependent endonuclease of OLD family
MLRDQLYALAENSPFQVLCATHSAQMIDISKPHSSLVRIIKRENEETATHQVGHTLFQSDKFKDFIQMVNRYNPHVCETFYASNVLVVEGDTEAIVCREYLNEHHPESDIFILNSGSKNNIPFFQTILNHFSIDYGVLHDVDTRYIYTDSGRTTHINKKDGTPKKNSAWTINQNISDELASATGNKANRWVSVFDFESNNGYQQDPDLGKPMSAYMFYKENKGKELPIFDVLRNFIAGTNVVSQAEIDQIKEPVEP